MNLSIQPDLAAVNSAAADLLEDWLTLPHVRNVMLAGGNTPVPLYRGVGARALTLSHLNVFTLDEYVGVPPEEPRNCAQLIRRTAVEPWGVPRAQYFSVSSAEAEARQSIQDHECRLHAGGGVDVLVLGLGQNGHLGFNEPGSKEDSVGRVLELDPISIEANRRWFQGDYAPTRGATVGLKTILAARRILLVACGRHKTAAVKAMVDGPRTTACPASLLQGHPGVIAVLDRLAADGVRQVRA